MPLPMVHLAVGYEIGKLVKLDSPGAFLVGSIAPDAIHMRKNTDGEDKKRSHLYCKNMASERMMLDALKDYKRGEEKTENSREGRDFNTGYCIHLITDYYWFNSVFPELIRKIPHEIHSEPFRRKYYHDTDLIDSMIYEDAPWRGSVWNLLKKADGFSNKFLEGDEIERWVSRVINWFSPNPAAPGKNPVYLDYESVQRFIASAADRAYRRLGEEKILRPLAYRAE